MSNISKVEAKIVYVGLPDFDTVAFNEAQTTWDDAIGSDATAYIEAELPDFVDAINDDDAPPPRIRVICTREHGIELAPYLIHDRRVMLEVGHGVLLSWKETSE